MNDISDFEEMSEIELTGEISRRDWNISGISITTQGVSLTFREHYTSDFPGMETRSFFGRDKREAMQKFLTDYLGRSNKLVP